jgi:hypothetical protein
MSCATEFSGLENYLCGVPMLFLHELERADSLALTKRRGTARKNNNSNESLFMSGLKRKRHNG